MVNPPREEIRKIRLQLQQYGQVGDANVFYWFQNRKSRTKNKQRHLLSNRANSRLSSGTNMNAIATPSLGAVTNVSTSGISNSTNASSSSSSERSSGSSKAFKPVHAPMGTPEPVNMYNNFNSSVELSNLSEAFVFHNPQGYCFAIPEISSLIAAPEQVAGVGLGLWNEPVGSVTTQEEGIVGKENAEPPHGLGLSAELLKQEHFGGRENGGEERLKIGLSQGGCCFQTADPLVVASTALESSVVAAAVPAVSGVADAVCAAATVLSTPLNLATNGTCIQQLHI